MESWMSVGSHHCILPSADNVVDGDSSLRRVSGRSHDTTQQLIPRSPLSSRLPITIQGAPCTSESDELVRCEDTSPINEITLLMPSILLPRHNVSQATQFYLEVWRSQCLPAMHLSLHGVESLCGNSPLLADMVATLSACRLSRRLPQRKTFRISGAPGLCFRPDAGHECLSGEFYGSAMRKVAWWSGQELDANPTLYLVVLIMFCYMESSMGNFSGFHLHSKGVEKLVTSFASHTRTQYSGLLAAWAEIKMQNWWRRAYFSVSEVSRDYTIPILYPQWESEPSIRSNGSRTHVLSLLCESQRLNTAAIVACWEDPSAFNCMVNPNNECSLMDVTKRATREQSLSWQNYVAMVHDQSKRLDNWFASLPLTDFSAFTSAQQDSGIYMAGEQEPKALLFRSHQVAMNFAYYVTARVIQCIGPLQSLRSISDVEIDYLYEEAETWIHLLLRIASGIDWKDCVRYNVYTIGFSGLLLSCLLCSRYLATGLQIQRWLEKQLKGEEFEEGNFPVFQILDAIRLINQERSEGRDVFSLFQTVDDAGGNGKFGSYHSQQIICLLVYGRCRATGTIISYHATA